MRRSVLLMVGAAVVMVVGVGSGAARPGSLVSGDAILSRTSAPSGWIAFVSDRDGPNAVYAIRPDGTQLRRLVANASDPRFSLDGRKLAFIGWNGDPSLRVLDLATGQQKVVVAPGVVPLGWASTSWPWSPDSRRIAYGSDQGLRVVGADGSGDRQIAAGTAEVPAWSPDGKQIVFAQYRSGALEVVGADGRGLRRLARDGDLPEWSPDGKEIAFVTSADVTLVIPAAGGTARKIARGFFAWSPDSRTLAVALEGGGISLYGRDGRLQRVLLGKGEVEGPVWAPDGKSVTAVVGGDLWLFARDGSRTTRLTQGARYGYNNSDPTWGQLSNPAYTGTPVQSAPTTDSKLHGTTVSTKSPVAYLAADGRRVVVTYDPYPNCSELWDVPAHRLVRFAMSACRDAPGAPAWITGLALAGSRVAWGLHQHTMLHEYAWLVTSAEDHPALKTQYAGTGSETLGRIAGGGNTLAFESVRPTGRRIIILNLASKPVQHVIAGGGLLAASDAGILRQQGSQTLELLRREGSVALTIHTNTPIVDAALADGKIAILGARVLETYSAGTGRLLHRLTVPAGRYLAGYAAGIAAIAQQSSVVAIRTTDGARTTIPISATTQSPGPYQRRAALTSAGLFSATTSGGADRISFLPLADLSRRLKP